MAEDGREREGRGGGEERVGRGEQGVINSVTLKVDSNCTVTYVHAPSSRVHVLVPT